MNLKNRLVFRSIESKILAVLHVCTSLTKQTRLSRIYVQEPLRRKFLYVNMSKPYRARDGIHVLSQRL